MFFKGFRKENAEDSAADKLTDSDGKSEERKGSLKTVGVAQHKGNYHHVCYNGRNGGELYALIAKRIGY